MLKQCLLADGRVVPGQDQDCPIQVYVAPDEAEKRLLVEKYKIDEHTLNSALDPDEQARIEFEPDHVAVIVKQPKNYSGRDKLAFQGSIGRDVPFCRQAGRGPVIRPAAL